MAKLAEPLKRKRACPICGKPAAQGFDPFCSKRCADIDLSRWLKGVYAIPGDTVDEASEAEAPSRDRKSDEG
jgi:uncharacterized protein